jgi:hypothetical protein
MATAGQWRRSAELGTSLSATAAAAAASEEADLAGNGLSVNAGLSYVIDLPPASGSIEVSGAAGRVMLLDRGGKVLSDNEGAGSWQVELLDGASLLVAAGLGSPSPVGGEINTASPVGGGTGALSSQFAPSGAIAATGWESGSLLAAVSAQTLLCRGGWLTLDRPQSSRRQRVSTHLASVRAASAVAEAAGVQTWLPASTTTVAILLDQVDPTAAFNGDLAVAVIGASLVDPPSRIGGGRRLVLLYEVSPAQGQASRSTAGSPGAPPIGITAASLTGWRVAGVVGLPGVPAEWAARWNGAVPEHLVADGPLSPDGTIVVRITTPSPDPAAGTFLSPSSPSPNRGAA